MRGQGRDLLDNLACGTLAAVGMCAHTAILISDLSEVDLTFDFLELSF